MVTSKPPIFIDLLALVGMLYLYLVVILILQYVHVHFVCHLFQLLLNCMNLLKLELSRSLDLKIFVSLHFQKIAALMLLCKQDRDIHLHRDSCGKGNAAGFYGYDFGNAFSCEKAGSLTGHFPKQACIYFLIKKWAYLEHISRQHGSLW